MFTRLQSLLLAKTHSAILAVVLCFSVLGIQSVGLFHGVVHSNQEQHIQSSNVFDGIEKAFSSNPQKSNQICKLLDELLLGTSAISQQLDSHFLSFNHIAPIAAIQISFPQLKFWLYQPQAPPQSNA